MPFIGKQSTSNSQITNYTTTVGSGGQTNFTVVIEGGDETHVYLNGVLLKETTDYTVSSTQVSLVSPAVENDIVEIKVFRSFALVDAVRASTGGTFSGDVTVPNLTLSSNVIKASDGGSTITLDTSDNVTIAGGGTFGGTVDLQGNELILDTDGDTSITADTNDQIDIKVGGTDRVQIDSSGNVELKTTNADLILPSGGGISFQNHSVSSVTGASSTTSDNVLDDYEEGTWTPTFSSGSAYTSNFTYIKIGKVVHITGYLASVSGFPSSGILAISGLPFAGNADYQMSLLWYEGSASTIAAAYMQGGSSALNVRPIGGYPSTFSELSVQMVYRTS